VKAGARERGLHGIAARPLTEWLPKPAVPVCGLPLVRFALARLAAAGVRRAVVNTHHLAGPMAEAARVIVVVGMITGALPG